MQNRTVSSTYLPYSALSDDELCHFRLLPVLRYLILLQILRSFCYCCKIHSALSSDEITLLYERARTITDYLIDYDIKDKCQVQSPAIGTSAYGGAHASSPEPASIGNA